MTILRESSVAAPPMAVLIPAYRPNLALLRTLRDLRSARPDWRLLVVDDGSGAKYEPLFRQAEQLGAEVVRHDHNQGKGAALKSGFAHLASVAPQSPVVCADADGQHSVADIVRVADRLSHDPAGRRLILGTREFSGEVPLRSRFGNAVTGRLFSLVTGRRLSDTQTGLRGLPSNLLAWATSVPGDRYEYELRMLLQARSADIDFDCVPIATIYLDDNESSHFRPVADSLRIYLPLLGFIFSAVGAFLVDTAALLILQALTGNLLLSVVGARLISASLNFVINRQLVFDPHRQARTRTALTKYAVLAVVLLSINYVVLSGLTAIDVPLIVAKVGTELFLFAVSFLIQRHVVFAPSRATPR